MTRRTFVRWRGGLTLLEVMVALTLTTVVAVIARATLDISDRFAAREQAATIAHDKQLNLERHLRGLVARSFVSGSASRFYATPHRFELSTYCETTGGWQEECRVAVTIAAASPETVVLSVPQQLPGELVFEAPVRLSYLHASGDWVAAWDSETTLPLAVALSFGDRLLLFRVGERG